MIRGQTVVFNLVLAVVYAGLAFLSTGWFLVGGVSALLWPAAGVAVVAVLLGGPRYLPGIVLGAWSANMLAFGQGTLALGLALVNALEALSCAWVWRRWQGSLYASLQQPLMYLHLLAAAAIASAGAAVLGAGCFAVFSSRIESAGDLAAAAFHWWQGDWLGIVLITPLLLIWRRLPVWWQDQRALAEFGLLLMLAVLLAFWPRLPFESVPDMVSRELLVFWLLVWAALRFGAHGVLLLIIVSASLFWVEFKRDQMTLADVQQFWFFVFALTIVGVILALKVDVLRRAIRQRGVALAAEAAVVERFNHAQKISRSGCWEYEMPSGKLAWSEEIYRIFELDPQQYSPSYETFLSFVHPADRSAVDEAFQRSVSTREAYGIVHRLLMPDGRIKWVNEAGETYYDANGTPLRTVGTVQDVTSHKQATDSALAESESRLRGIFETVVDAIIIINDRGIIEMANAAACRMFGYSAGEMTGANVNLLMPRAIRHEHNRYLDNYLHTRVSGIIGVGRELLAVDKNGREFPIDLAISELPLKSRVSFVGVIRDITERKQKDDALTRAKDAAEAANLAKSQFLASMTHELRTPLNSVLGMVQLLLMEDLSERQRSCLTVASHAGNHLLALINNILDYTKVEAGKIVLHPEPCNIAGMLESLAQMFAAQAAEKLLAFSTRIDEAVPEQCFADPLRLRQVLINLVHNAIKFTSSGFVQVSVGVMHTAGRNVLRFAVDDSGIGIPEHESSRLFKEFHQVDNSLTRQFGGTGLGLAICRLLVEQMGGQIDVEARPGGGSCFWFTLPLQTMPQPNATPGDEAGRGADVALHGLRVVLADSGASMHKSVLRLLQGRGALVSVVASSAALCDALARQDVDAVVLALPLGTDVIAEWLAALQQNGAGRDLAKMTVLLPSENVDVAAILQDAGIGHVLVGREGLALLPGILQTL